MSLEVESVTAMDNLSKRIAQLPREKRELLLRRLQAENQQTVQKAQLPSITHMESDRWLPFPLSDIQKVYWVGQHDLFSLNTRATNVYLEYDIVNDDRSLIDRINHALLSLIERHDMLRAIILPDGTQYVPSTPLVFESSVVDLQHQSSLSINDSLEQARSALRIKRSTIGEWSCFDSMIHILPDKHIRWHLRIDSLVFDGTSRNVFMREIASLIRTPTISLPPMQCTYRDYVTFWNMLREHSLFQQSSSYWANLIPKLPHAPQLPLHPVEQHTQGHLTRNVFCVLDQKLWRQLKAKAKAHNLTPSIVVITAFTEILSAWSANVDYMIGLIGSDRPSIHEDIYNIIGNFNTVFLLTVQSPSESFIERAKALSHQLTEHMEHRYVSAFEVLRTCQRQHGWQSAPILPVMFNSLLEYNLPQFKRKDTREQFQKAVGSAEMIYSESAPPHLLLAPTVGEDAHERLVCNWRAVIQLFPEGLLQAMMEGYQRRLQDLADNDAAWRRPLTDRGVQAPASPGLVSEPNSSTRSVAQQATQPSSPMIDSVAFCERQLCTLWQEVLDLQVPTNTASFFDLGGTSFLAIVLLARIQQHFGIDIPADIFWNNLSIQKMSRYISIKLQEDAMPR